MAALFPSLWHSVNHFALTEALILTLVPPLSSFRIGHRPFLPRLPSNRALRCLRSSSLGDDGIAPVYRGTIQEASPREVASPISGAEDVLMGFVMGKRKATELAHSVWKNIVKKGDVVIDATCGNGYDTLALLKLVADESEGGFVYGMDIQKSALMNTSTLLDQSVNQTEKARVKLFHHCHSKMEDVIPKETSARLVAFNLGYLPGGDKAVITLSQTTKLALHAASNILESGGLISVVVYVGHCGGREELESVEAFAASLPAECWVSCKFEVLNRPTAPIVVLFFKK